MTSIHDDFPKPIPPLAYLRYKDNYYFLIMCPDEGIVGGLHFNNEPGFDRTKLHFDLNVKGKRVTYHNVVPISPNFGKEPFVSDGVATMTVVKSHELFTIQMKTDELDLDLTFEARFPTFDFAACKYAAPDMVSGIDVLAHGLNTPYEHMEQPMTVSGSIRSGADEAVSFGGPAFRDHSWGARADNLAAWHIFSVINFADRSFGMYSQRNRNRSGLMAREGFVVDDAGARAIRMMTTTSLDFADGAPLPQRVVFEIADAIGENYTLEADIAGRLGELGLKPEVAAAGQVAYSVTDNYCAVKDVTSGDVGFGLTQMGYHPDWKAEDRFV